MFCPQSKNYISALKITEISRPWHLVYLSWFARSISTFEKKLLTSLTVMKPVRLLCYMFLLAFLGHDRKQSWMASLSFWTHWPIETSHKFIQSICEQKTRDCARSGSFQHNLQHRCLQLWCLTVFITPSLFYWPWIDKNALEMRLCCSENKQTFFEKIGRRALLATCIDW